MELVSVKRPNFGTLGQKIQIYTNHFQVQIPKQGYFYHYDVDIQLIKGEKPAEEGAGDQTKKPAKKGRGGDKPGAAPRINKELKKKIWNIFLKQHQKAGGLFEKILPVWDGEKNLYTMKELKIDPKGNVSAEVTVPKDPEGGERQARVAVQPCASSFRAAWSGLSELMELEKKPSEPGAKRRPLPVDILSCINTVFREAAIATQNKVAAGRSFYWDPQFVKEAAVALGMGMECWPGFYSSVRPSQWTLTLNLDVANTAFYVAQPVLHFLCQTMRLNDPSRFDPRMSRDFEREIKGVKVEYTAPLGPRRYRVMRLSKMGADKETFIDDKGKKVTVKDYFKQHNKKDLEFPQLPCLEVGTKGSMLPMEVCKIVPGQKVQRKLNEEQTAIMVKHCAQRAPVRQNRVNSIRKTIMDYDKSDHLKEFGIKVDGVMKPVEARILPMPAIGQMGNNGVVTPVSVNRIQGTWEGLKFIAPKDLLNWSLISLEDPGRYPCQQFIRELIGIGGRLGMKISEPVFFDDKFNARDPDFPGMFRKIIDSFQKKNLKVDLIMVIFPRRSPNYADVKKAGDIVFGIPTQCALADKIKRNADRGMGQYAGNVLLKINVKLGGVNSQVHNLMPQITAGGKSTPNKDFLDLMKPFVTSPTIIFGCDVTHPSPGEGTSKPSIAALVASFDRRFTQYGARVRAQAHREEMVQALKDMVIELMIEFKNRNGGKEPQRIIFYRDGVSEGQYLQVMKDELSAVQQACLHIAPNADYKPPITYVIVGKRHHTRMFPFQQVSENDRGNKAGNVAPGTITDRDICHFSEFDFFLCSHFGIQGTSRPAHYNVLWDDAKFSADQIQMFSYYLTFVYARCNRSVSIPAPVYYAHHVAFRARYHLEDRNAIETASAFSGDTIASADLTAMNQKIKVNEKITGMYFA